MLAPIRAPAIQVRRIWQINVGTTGEQSANNRQMGRTRIGRNKKARKGGLWQLCDGSGQFHVSGQVKLHIIQESGLEQHGVFMSCTIGSIGIALFDRHNKILVIASQAMNTG